MNNKILFPWQSPLTARTVATAQAVRRELRCHNNKHYLLERRPKEQGRTVLLELSQGKVQELLPSNYSVRCRIHEYGGGSYLPTDDGIFFVEESNQQIYCLDNENKLKQITHDHLSRFGDFCEHASKSGLICVRESHQGKKV